MHKKIIPSKENKRTSSTSASDDKLVNELIAKRKLQQDALLKIINAMEKQNYGKGFITPKSFKAKPDRMLNTKKR